MTLDLNQLHVESFDTVAGEPTQWLHRPVTDKLDTCYDNLAPTPPYESCGCHDL